MMKVNFLALEKLTYVYIIEKNNTPDFKSEPTSSVISDYFTSQCFSFVLPQRSNTIYLTEVLKTMCKKGKMSDTEY